MDKSLEFFAGYVIHESHDAADVSDVSLIYDFICRHCKKSDEELEEPCELNPDWQVAI